MATIDKNILCKRLDYENNQINVKEMTNFIMNEFEKSGKEEIIIVNIGTDKCIGDSFGPFLGSYLKEKDYSMKVYGTLEYPIHALNIQRSLDRIKDIHKNPFIISLDSALSIENTVGNIVLRNKPIEAGVGVGKNLPSVGDVSIIYNACDIDKGFFGLMNDVRIGNISKVVKEIYNVFNELEKVYDLYKIKLNNIL